MASFNLRRDKDVLDLNMSDLELTQVTSSLRRFKNLTRVWLHSNCLRELSFIQNSYALSELYLQFNLIKSIGGCLRNLTNLKVLLLHGNEIFDLKTTVKELGHLRDLRNLSKDFFITINNFKVLIRVGTNIHQHVLVYSVCALI